MRKPHDHNWFLTEATKIHGNEYHYPEQYKKLSQKLKIICPVHGEFFQTPNKHIFAKTKCPSCSKKFKNTELFISQSNKIHNFKYIYPDQYTKGHSKIKIICPIHGEFFQTPINHTSLGHGCKQCANELNRTTKAMTLDDFITKASKIHNFKYDYHTSQYINNNTKIKIICPIHGLFTQRPAEHLRGSGCSRCYPKYSYPAIQWLESIMESENIHIQHALNDGEYQIPSTKYKADGYCKETNTIYEFYGDYWHGNPNIFQPDEQNAINFKTMGELYQKTIEREQEILALQYSLIIIWESEYKNQISFLSS